MIRIALLGCGRIGRMHAKNIAAHSRTELVAAFDINEAAAKDVTEAHNARLVANAGDIFAASDIDAVLIATATDTHSDYIEMAVAAGKPILCEKPIDLNLNRVNECAAKIAGTSVPIQIGFNRRFDPGHVAARDAMRRGEIGDLHQVIITSRDPAMAPRTYLETSGGLFRDMTIHDFDLARFMLDGDPVTEVFAIAGALVDPALGKDLSDVDTAMITLRSKAGRQVHINNSRAAAYGYDQRVELFGAAGMVQSGNRKQHECQTFSAKTTEAAAPYQHFFIDRYADAFMAEIDGFVDCIENGAQPIASFEDGRQALILAEAAYLSLGTGQMVKLDEVESQFVR